MKTENQNREAQKTNLLASKLEAKRELARLSEERRDARDRDDKEEVKAITKMTHELNLQILNINKALRELAA